MTKRDRMIMMKRERPKRVTLPNGRTFIARYQCATCAHFPANVRLAQPYKERAAPKSRWGRRRQVVQQGRETGSKLLKLVKKLAKAPVTQKIGKMALNEIYMKKEQAKLKTKKLKICPNLILKTPW